MHIFIRSVSLILSLIIILSFTQKSHATDCTINKNYFSGDHIGFFAVNGAGKITGDVYATEFLMRSQNVSCDLKTNQKGFPISLTIKNIINNVIQTPAGAKVKIVEDNYDFIIIGWDTALGIELENMSPVIVATKDIEITLHQKTAAEKNTYPKDDIQPMDITLKNLKVVEVVPCTPHTIENVILRGGTWNSDAVCWTVVPEADYHKSTGATNEEDCNTAQVKCYEHILSTGSTESGGGTMNAACQIYQDHCPGNFPALREDALLKRQPPQLAPLSTGTPVSNMTGGRGGSTDSTKKPSTITGMLKVNRNANYYIARDHKPDTPLFIPDGLDKDAIKKDLASRVGQTVSITGIYKEDSGHMWVHRVDGIISGVPSEITGVIKKVGDDYYITKDGEDTLLWLPEDNETKKKMEDYLESKIGQTVTIKGYHDTQNNIIWVESIDGIIGSAMAGGDLTPLCIRHKRKCFLKVLRKGHAHRRKGKGKFYRQCRKYQNNCAQDVAALEKTVKEMKDKWGLKKNTQKNEDKPLTKKCVKRKRKCITKIIKKDTAYKRISGKPYTQCRRYKKKCGGNIKKLETMVLEDSAKMNLSAALINVMKGLKDIPTILKYQK